MVPAAQAVQFGGAAVGLGPCPAARIRRARTAKDDRGQYSASGPALWYESYRVTRKFGLVLRRLLPLALSALRHRAIGSPSRQIAEPFNQRADVPL
jgi:hypothetical protein